MNNIDEIGNFPQIVDSSHDNNFGHVVFGGIQHAKSSILCLLALLCVHGDLGLQISFGSHRAVGFSPWHILFFFAKKIEKGIVISFHMNILNLSAL